jgi:hypothetical protein
MFLIKSTVLNVSLGMSRTVLKMHRLLSHVSRISVLLLGRKMICLLVFHIHPISTCNFCSRDRHLLFLELEIF